MSSPIDFAIDMDKDYYTILGIPTNANDRQITSAFKKLSLKCFPDRNPDNIEAQTKFKDVHEAYNILIDETKRSQYDSAHKLNQDNSNISINNSATANEISSLGGIGRVIGAMFSTFNAPMPSHVAPEIIEIAQQICRSGTLEGNGGPSLDPRVSDIHWGISVDSKVERQSALYYRLNVENRHIENGFLIMCRSANKGRFKILIFDTDGTIIAQEDSLKFKDKTQTVLFFTNFDAFRLGEPPASHDNPPLFNKLDNFIPCKKSVASGQYLICIYCDNFIGKSNFNITALLAKNDAAQVIEMEEMDDNLNESKAALHALKLEYLQAKAAYEAVLLRMKLEGDKIENGINAREKAYAGFYEASFKAFCTSSIHSNPKDVTNNNNNNSNNEDDDLLHNPSDDNKGYKSDEGENHNHTSGHKRNGSSGAVGVSVALGAVASTVASTATAVTSSAATSAGSVFKRLSLNMQSYLQPVKPTSAAGTSANEDTSDNEKDSDYYDTHSPTITTATNNDENNSDNNKEENDYFENDQAL
eukprot:gene5791-7989_t